MSVKEKVQQIIQQAELEKAAKLRLQEEQRLRLEAELQERRRQMEVLSKARFERGKKTLEATGVPKLFGEVLDIIKAEDPEVEMFIRSGFTPSGRETVGVFVEKERKKDLHTTLITKLGVEVEIDDSNRIWVTSAYERYDKQDLFNGKDRDLLLKLENRLAKHIAEHDHSRVDVWEPPDLSPP